MINDLNNSNVIELIKEYQSSNDERVFDKLFLMNQGLIRFCVNKFGLLHFEGSFSVVAKEDLISIANRVFFDSVKSFDFSKGFSFSSYYSKACKNEFCKLLVYLTRHEGATISLDSPISNKKNNDKTLGEVVKDDRSDNGFNEIIDSADFEILLNKARKILNDKEFTVLYEMSVNNRNHPEISKIMGVSRQRVSNIAANVKQKLLKNSFFKIKYDQLIKENGGKPLKRHFHITKKDYLCGSDG